jgi:hypothetical protein
MRTWFMAGAGLATLGLAVTAGLVLSGQRAAQAAASAKNNEEGPKAANLPLSQVVLFSSGVGYFQREGSVEGDARVDLAFDVRDINDLLKSMVLRDLDKGHITAVSYDSNAPLERTLKSFAVNLTGNPTFADLLHQVRGEKVEVVLSTPQAGAAGTATGTIIGVEKQRQAVAGAKEVVEVTLLNLWCADGIKAFKLAEVQRVRLLNAVLDSEFKKALETLALSHDTQKKAVSIRCEGEGKRRISVSYVVENPIWKTSYRLVLGTKKADKPYLQGWAVVENPTDEDWKGVRMALISGRPISFQMDLYTPLYVPRPVVVPELFQSLRPVAYSGAMDGPTGTATAGAPPPPMPENKPAAKATDFYMGFQNGQHKAGGAYALGVQQQLRQNMNLGRSGVGTAATAAKLGDFFQYAIDRPVSLARQKSALLPIVGKDVQATRLSIYNERTQAKFPLLGLRFKNTSGAHLMQGPITIFEGSNYAGDAQVLDLQPNEERLLSYAVDLGTEVNAVPSSDSGRVLSLKAVKGIVWTTVKNRQIKTYTVKNRNEQARTVLVEHPVNNAFRLTGEKPLETAADVYRFKMEVPAGATKTLVVSEEREDRHNYAVSNQSDEQIKWLISQPTASKKLQAGLREALALRLALHKTQREIGELQRQLNVIVQDQTRIRANLKETPSTSKAHKRYLEKLDEQESQIEKYQGDIKKLNQSEHDQKKAFDDFLVRFSVE